MTVVDVSSSELVINQTAFYLALIISVSSIIAISVQAFRGISKRIGKARAEYETRLDAKHEAMRAEIVDLKERTDYLYRKLINGVFDEKRKDTK